MATPCKKLHRRYPNDPLREVQQAARRGDAVFLNRVLGEMDINERVSALCMSCQRTEDFPPLHRAICLESGSYNVLSCLIENGADVNVRSPKDKCTPLMIATQLDKLDLVTLLLKHGARVDLQDQNGKTCLHYAVAGVFSVTSCDVLSCLLENGADINATTNDNCTPLMIASCYEGVNVIDFLLERGADVFVKNKHGETALHFACRRIMCFNVLSCLIENGADINACTNDNCTPLMVAIKNDLVHIVRFLIEHGANVDLQDKNGDTALHYVVCSLYHSSEIVSALTAAGASQMYNNEGLTPLLVAGNRGNVAVVERLIKRPDVAKEQRIDALELLGASVIINLYQTDMYFDPYVDMSETTNQGFTYIRRGMEERFVDPLHLLLKQPMEPIDAYQSRRESQSLDELMEIDRDSNDLILESLLIKERILGYNATLLGGIRTAAHCYEDVDVCVSIGLWKHALRTARRHSESATEDICGLSEVFRLNESLWSDQQKRAYVVELLEQIIHEVERMRDGELMRENDKSHRKLRELVDCSMHVLSCVSKFQYSEMDDTLPVSVLTRRLCALNPQDFYGKTLLHVAVQGNVIESFSFLKNTVKILLNAGLNVNATDCYGNMPLHLAATSDPRRNEVHHLTDMLEMLLDKGAHHDFVNRDGKTAMDLAETDEVRNVLFEKRKLELKCISARAVKRFGLHYLGVVPKVLEDYISRH